jgi:hypothetical protein
MWRAAFQPADELADYQRQIQIVTDPAEIEVEGRRAQSDNVRRCDETPTTFRQRRNRRHFQQNYLPGLVRSVSELTIDGPASRHLQDRVLNRLIENEWTRETRSPSPMMQELAARFREAGLHVFRHRRGMLFVSSIYPRPFKHDESGVSPQVRAILESIETSPRIGRKELADKLIADLTADEAERVKMALASDLRWLISEGYASSSTTACLICYLCRCEGKCVRQRRRNRKQKARSWRTSPPRKEETRQTRSPPPPGESNQSKLQGSERL